MQHRVEVNCMSLIAPQTASRKEIVDLYSIAVNRMVTYRKWEENS